MPTVRATTKNIKKAAAIIRAGGIVAFPTETVYGLGANAFDAKAVQKIFKAKGRPQNNPLIVHIASKKDLSKVAVSISHVAEKLIAHFWPGPLTLILKRGKNVPPVVSAGLPTAAVRMPDHKVARAFIRAAGVPIAAPSANKSGRPSPTEVVHVARDFGEKLFILDGGKTKIGLESTVVDLTATPPVILRQGAITREILRRVIKNIRVLDARVHQDGLTKSPGMKYRHYAPRAPLIIAGGRGQAMFERMAALIHASKARRIGALTTEGHLSFFMRLNDPRVITIALGSRRNLRVCARNLFAVLRQFDTLNVDVIVAESFPERGIGAAIMDRLRRAAE